MTIYNSSGAVIYEAPITKDAIIKHTLMEDYYIEIPFEVTDIMPFGKGCYILYKGHKFEIMENVFAEPLTNKAGYKYILRFEAQQSHMKRCKLFWRGSSYNEVTFHNTTDLRSFGTLVCHNVNMFLGAFNWSVGSIPEDLEEQTKLISFNGDSCWDALNMIAETFEVEWWLVEDVVEYGVNVTLNFGKLELGTEEEFKAGDVVSSIPVRSGDDSDYGTRFYVFGSTRNLPESYSNIEQGGITNHVSEVRLRLPNNQEYIDAWEDLQPQDVVEQVVFFDDIFPKNTETVTAISTVDREIIEGQKNKAWVMTCANTPFTPADMLEGEEFGCTFTSGSLMGRSFELSINTENFDKKFELIAQTEGDGDNIIIIPNASLHPEVGDTFILTGVNLPKARITEAENELLDKGTSWAVKKSRDTNIYDCPTNAVYCHKNDKNYELGQKVRLVGEQFGKDGRSSRIQGYEKKLYDEYQATYTVGDNTAYSRFGTIEKNIEQAAYAERIGVVSGVGIYVIRSKYDTTLPSDSNVYSALAAEALFLSKKKGGIVEGDTTFKKSISVGRNITSEDFVDAGMTGAGFGITRDENGNAVISADIIKVRKKAEFYELVINQTTFELGDTIKTAGGCTITSVEVVGDAYRCYYDNHNGSRLSGFKIGDQARCQRYDASFDAITKYYWRVVKEVGDNYIDLYIAGVDANGMALAEGGGIPEEGDAIVQFGSRNNIERQSAIVLSPLNGGSIVVFAGINSFSLSEKNYVGFGVDPNTKEAYIYGYGDVYIGDRDTDADGASYVTYQKKSGDSKRKVYISADVNLGANSTGLSNLSEYKSLEKATQDAKQTAQNAEASAKSYADELVKDLQNQLDSKVESYFFDYNPTTSNLPASEWTTDDLKADHLNDTFTNTQSGQSWRWLLKDGVYQWVEIADTQSAEALAKAQEALGVANGKVAVFVVEPRSPYNAKDLWLQGEDGRIKRCTTTRTTTGEFHAEDWVNADDSHEYAEGILAQYKQSVDATVDSLNKAIEDAEKASKTYTDEGKQALQASINALNLAKANATDVYTKAEADGKIDKAEEDAIKAAEDLANAARELAEATVRAYADGVVDEEEKARLAQAEQNLNEAKAYAEQKANEAENNAKTYADGKVATIDYLKEAFPLGAILDVNGVTLAALMGVKNQSGDVVAGLYGGASETLNTQGYYDATHGTMLLFGGVKNVDDPTSYATAIFQDGFIESKTFATARSGKRIVIENNTLRAYGDDDSQSVLEIAYDDAGKPYLGYYNDSTGEDRWYLSESGISTSYTVAQVDDLLKQYMLLSTPQEVVAKHNFTNGLKIGGVELRKTEDGNIYLDGNLVLSGGVTMYGADGTPSASLFDALPIDGVTIKWVNGKLTSIGGGGDVNIEGITLEDVEAYLEDNNYITRDALAPYATSNSVSALLGNYLPLSSFTKDTIKSTLGISDWALASSLEWSAINSKPTDINGYGMVEYLTNLNNATLNKFFRSSFQASNRPAYNYAVGFTLGNTSISANYAAQLAIDYYGGVHTRYKASTEWSEWVELAPLSSVPTKLSQLTDDVVAGKYLSLSGGTVYGTFTAKDRVHIDMGAFGNAQLKFSTLNGSEIMLFVKGGDWRITDDNFSYFRRLLHSDNFSDYALPKDGTAANSEKFGGMIPRYYLSAPSGDFTDFNGEHWNTIYEYRKGDGISYDNDPLGIGWGAFISLRSNKGTDGLQFLAQELAGKNKLLYRCKPRRSDVGQSNKWSEVASLDSNVASATKLATPRTIWGQSFDGTNDIARDLFIPSAHSLILAHNDEGIYIGKDGVFWHNASNVWTANLMLFTSDKVGIGVTPTEKLEVGGNLKVGGTIKLGKFSKVLEYAQGEYIDQYGNPHLINNVLSHYWGVFGTDSKAILSVHGNGFVGIGTTTPSAKLDVNGSAKIGGDLTLNGGILSYNNGVWTLNGDLLVTGGVTQFAQGVKTATSIMDAIVVDGTTITKQDGKLVAIGGGGSASSIDWSGINNKPTTLAGYGIADAVSEAITIEVVEKTRDFYTRSEAREIFALKTSLDDKQNTLFSGVNIKTINGQSVLGEGNIEISGSGGGVVYVTLDVSKLTTNNTFYITESELSSIKMSRNGNAVIVKDTNSTTADSEWGQVVSCYRQYAGSSVYTYRVSILHKDNDPLSGADNAKLYNVDIMDSPQSSGYYCTVTSINNLY